MKLLVSPRASRLWITAFLLAGAMTASRLGAEPSPSEAPTPTVSSPPPTSVPDTSSSNSGNNYYEPPSSYRSWDNFDTGFPRERATPRPAVETFLPIYYPPMPPVLGAPIPSGNSYSFVSSLNAPRELQDFVSEYFYPALGTRLVQKTIGSRLLARIEAYRTEKSRLQNELRNRLAETATADPAARRQELAQFAKIQTPQIVALEKTAEELRDTLIRGEFFRTSVDWNDTRSWRLGTSRFRTATDAFNAQHQVMQAAAFYQRGLLPEQRGLLREITAELQETGPRGRNTEGIAPPLFFSPATSRFRLPLDLPRELAGKIARYEQEKSALKQELREAVEAQDKSLFSHFRGRALEALADRQWPQIARLEALAEEIRVDFEQLVEPVGPPALPTISPVIVARITSYMTEKKSFESEVAARIEEFKKKFGVGHVLGGRGGRDVRLVIKPGPNSEMQREALKAALVDFNRELADRQIALRNDLAGIRKLLEESPEAMAGGQSPELYLRQYGELLHEREEWKRYADYQAAMFTPGLSPEQRRLLYDGGVQQLELPLPRWERTRVNVIQ